MEHITFSIDESNGDVMFLVNELSRSFVTDTSSVKRASHVEPINPALRVVFYALRGIFGEYGKVGAFTRVWPCDWRVNLTPVNGPILSNAYSDRQKAIDAEIQWLEENFL